MKLILVANKIDMEGEREVLGDVGYNLAEKWGAIFIEISARNHEQIQSLFRKVAQLSLD